MKILVTGFEPFHGETINPALEVLHCLKDEIAHAQIIKLEIPTVVYTCLNIIEKVIDEQEPDMILSLGQAGGRSCITVERIGININDFGIVDNAGNQPIDEAIFADGAAAYFVNLPIKAMVKRIREAGVPASISDTAGTFVCNHVTYGVRYIIEKKGKHQKSGFLHIPYLPSQVVDKAGMPSMALADMVSAVHAAIEAMIEGCEVELKGEGRIC